MREHVKSLEVISAGLAHEIHNPLSAIRTALFVIEEQVQSIYQAANPESGGNGVDKSRAKIERMQDIAKRGVSRIERVVQLVRNYAREGYPRELTAVELDAMLGDLAPLIIPADDREIELSVEPGAPEAFIYCIPEEMEQVIRNLWQNAIDAVSDGGHVVTKTFRHGDFVVVQVSDDGPGIDDAVLPRIFTPFFTTKQPGKGLGLGLAISHQVVSQCGGEIIVDSRKGRGTTFSVRLPSAPAGRAKSVVANSGTDEQRTASGNLAL
jgi:signal transduction histidine kinase